MSKTKNSMITGNMWTILFGLAFSIWGTICLVGRVVYSRNITGSPWLLLLGGLMIVGVIANIINYRYNRDKVLNALEAYPRIGLENLSSELKMKKKELKDMIIDLRTEGLVQASFDTDSGDVIVLSVKGKPPIAPVSSSGLPEHEDKISPYPKEYREQGYCQYCGSLTQKDDMFCNNCGSSLK